MNTYELVLYYLDGTCTPVLVAFHCFEHNCFTLVSQSHLDVLCLPGISGPRRVPPGGKGWRMLGGRVRGRLERVRGEG